MLKSIDNGDQYDLALARVYELMQKDIKENTADFKELNSLTILIMKYENEYYPIPKGEL